MSNEGKKNTESRWYHLKKNIKEINVFKFWKNELEMYREGAQQHLWSVTEDPDCKEMHKSYLMF